ncbi:CoA-transferase family III [Microthyrium microscopicum]|uniref:CoA-transferase family III n=1 Tax=Microthyrium microscopicum TaxID=703497 RepID=A0A6A6U3A9_9PEZI|nr:CoA-transferase family III [Microthyrium microscopicum]
MASLSHSIALNVLDEVLEDFGLSRKANGTTILFTGDIPSQESTKSQIINLSLIGSIPALANAVAATQIYEARGGQAQNIDIDLRRGHNYIDPDIGMTPTINGQEITLDLTTGNPFLNNIFETADGRFVILSAVYVDLVYQWTAFLNTSVQIDSVRAAVKRWPAAALEEACALAGLPMAIVSSATEWAAHPQGAHLSKLPIAPIDRISTPAPPLLLSPNPKRPLEGVKVLCLTHAIAGPSAGRTLAEHGASVLQLMSTHGHEHAFVYTYANLGTASTRLNLHKLADRERVWTLVRQSHVWLDSYRAGALSKFGFSDDALRAANPGIIVSHVRCYGTTGPWANKPGFDMQGSASSGLMDACGDNGKPAWPPGMVINDYTTGYFGALGVMAALLRRMREGGSYVVSQSLTGTAMGLLRVFGSARWPQLREQQETALAPLKMRVETKLGVMRTLAPLPVLSGTPIVYSPIFLEPMGSAKPMFPGYEDGYDVDGQEPLEKHAVGMMMGISMRNKLKKLQDMGKEAKL